MNSKGKKVSFSFCAALASALLFFLLTNNAAQAAAVTEQFGTASDGTPLHWTFTRPAPAAPGP